MATAIINGVPVTGSVEEIYSLIQRATTTTTITTSLDFPIKVDI